MGFTGAREAWELEPLRRVWVGRPGIGSLNPHHKYEELNSAPSFTSPVGMNPNPSTTRPASLLLVDDTPAHLDLLGRMSRELGYSVRQATSGPLALAAAQARPPDLILLDVLMPGMDGYQVCARLKAEERLKHIPVLFISSLSETRDRVKAFQAGGVDYLTKPFQIEEVAARVRTHLDLQRLRREAEGHNLRLESTVRERTRQLADANFRLVQLDRAKTDLLAVISHGLRTPLATLFGLVDLALAEFPGHPKWAAHRRLFQESRRRLLQLAEDTLLLSSLRLSDPHLSPQAVRLDDLLSGAIALVIATAAEQKVHLATRPSSGLEIAGDHLLLTQALACLLKTAVKFSEPGRDLVITSHATAAEVSVTLDAQGHSVPTEELPRFFHVLTAGQAIAPGGDLGLAPSVAAQILTLFGGRVEIANTASPGIRLLVSLPRYWAATRQ